MNFIFVSIFFTFIFLHHDEYLNIFLYDMWYYTVYVGGWYIVVGIVILLVVSSQIYSRLADTSRLADCSVKSHATPIRTLK